MPKKKILVFIDWYLPGTRSGGPVRSIANLVAHLKEEFQFLIVTRDTDYCEKDPYTNVQSNKWNKLDDQVSVHYVSSQNLNKKYLKELIASTEFDTAYINGIYSIYFSILPVWFLRNSGKSIVVAARGMLNSQAFSVKPMKKKAFLQVAKLAKLYKNTVFHATNIDEKENIKNLIKNPDIIVAPNLPRKLIKENFTGKDKKQLHLVSVARVAREKGTLITLKALQQLKISENIVYDIFGPIYDQSYWKECKTLIDNLPRNIRVSYKGCIDSEEVPALLMEYHFFIMPSEGENFGHAILEAFSGACPVIISDNTPWKNLKEKQIGWDVALDSREITSALKEAIAMDQETYNQWSANSWNFARKVINDPEVLEANRRLFI